jgi:hypothetical protein
MDVLLRSVGIEDPPTQDLLVHGGSKIRGAWERFKAETTKTTATRIMVLLPPKDVDCPSFMVVAQSDAVALELCGDADGGTFPGPKAVASHPTGEDLVLVALEDSLLRILAAARR